jgi:hypothetical protein
MWEFYMYLLRLIMLVDVNLVSSNVAAGLHVNFSEMWSLCSIFRFLILVDMLICCRYLKWNFTRCNFGTEIPVRKGSPAKPSLNSDGVEPVNSVL